MLQAPIIKFSWGCIVFLGFLGATFLIFQSYSDFKNSPVVTSVKTQPIDDLDFPTVTVCPPLGSNTALNFDLMRVDKNSLTQEMRKNLSRKATAIFDPFGPHEENIKHILASANEENLEQIFRGFQTFPKPYKTGFEVKVCNDEGTITTPGFGQSYNETYFWADKEHHTVLEFPENLKEYIGEGSLVIELDVDIRGQEEEVFYSVQSKYKFYNKRKNWEKAEEYCKKEGGHLASVQSQQENEEVSNFAGGRRIWIGGSDQRNKVWKWTDGSAWQFTKWNTSSKNLNCNSTKGYHCLQMQNGTWDSHPCYWKCAEVKYICQFDQKKHIIQNGTHQLEFSKNNLTFPSFQVWYKYKNANQKVMERRKQELTRMTGFRLSWKIQNPPLQINSTSPGQEIKTPNFGEPVHSASDHYNQSHDYTATIQVPEDMAEQIENGSLIVAIEVATNKGKETVTVTEEIPGSEKYKLYKEKKTWLEANEQCEKDGGHLASILSLEENNAVSDLLGRHRIWIGGRKEGKNEPWRWADGSDWGFSNWQDGRPHGKPWRCVDIQNKKWSDDWNCKYPNPNNPNSPPNKKLFLCQFFRRTLNTGKKNMTFQFTPENVTSVRVSVSYKYRVNNEQTTKWENTKTTGFRLKWFVQNNNGTGQICENCTEWKPKKVGPKYVLKKYWLTKMARLSKQLNGSLEDNVRKVLKAKLSSKRFLMNFDVWCFNGQIKDIYIGKLFDEILEEQNYNETEEEQNNNETEQDDLDPEEINHTDLKTGFMMFSAIIFCPSTILDLKLFKFLDELISNQSPRTLIQGIVNTLGSEDLDRRSSAKLNHFFQALDDIMDFKLGKILLGSSSPAKLQSMLYSGLPYITKYRDEIEMSLNSTNGSNMQSILESGETVESGS